jgi:hypothetical protein
MKTITREGILHLLASSATIGKPSLSTTEIATALGGSRATALRYLNNFILTNKVVQSGNARATRYRLPDTSTASNTTKPPSVSLPSDTYAQAILGMSKFNDPPMPKSYLLRLKYRWSLRDAMSLIVHDRKTAAEAISELGMAENVTPGFQAILLEELQKLEEFNCARYRLKMGTVRLWITDSRPH